MRISDWSSDVCSSDLLVVSGIPQAFISVFFAGSLLIEVIFSLDGLGRMSYEAAVSRDYPVVFGSLFIFTLFGLLIKLLGDLCYTLVEPRIDFAATHAWRYSCDHCVVGALHASRSTDGFGGRFGCSSASS